MATTLNFKDLIDLPEWRPLAVSLTAQAAGGGIASDLRNNEDRIPIIFQLGSATVLNSYNAKNDGWQFLLSPALAGTFGVGASLVVAPQRGPRGTLTTGNTTTSVVLSTSLPAAVGVNQLANRGDGIGYKIRIIGNAAGSSGKIEERVIIANTAGSTPTITVTPALSFTPASGDAFEFLSGRVYLLDGGSLAANIFKSYDIATGALAACTQTNLPATVNADTSMVVLDELYCPNLPGEGFILGTGDGGVNAHALTATGSSGTTLVGQSTGGDNALTANEFRNFQIRIVKDTVIPTAVGQRRKITSHTANAAGPTYTVPAWSVTPSTNAQYVIENTNEVLIWTSTNVATFTYVSDAVAGGQSADTVNTSTYGNRTAPGAGVCSFQAFGATQDATKNFRYSFIYSFRGGNATALDILDIAAGANGVWSSGVAYGGVGTLVTTGACGEYDQTGKYYYMSVNGLQTFLRFDAVNRVLESWATLRFGQGTAVVGARMASVPFFDGATKLCFIYVLRSSGTELFHIACQR